MNKECSVDVLMLKHEPLDDFALCMFQRGKRRSLLYVIFISIVILYSYAILIWFTCILFLQGYLKPIIFLNFWANIIFATVAEMTLSVLILYHGPETNNVFEENSLMKITCKIHWLTFSAVFPLLIISFVTFWSKLYEGMNVPFDIVTCNVTLFLWFCMFALTTFPLRLMHIYAFLALYIIYIVFTVILYECGVKGRNNTSWVYKYMDWKFPKEALLTCFIGLVIGLMAYVILYFVKLGMIKLRKKWENQE